MAAAIWALPLGGALIYISAGLTLFVAQRRILYQPHRYSYQRLLTRAQGLGLTVWQQHGNDYKGLIHTQSRQYSDMQILVFHGNAGSALDRSYYLSYLEDLGCRVILCEYPGYGARPGKRSEASFIKAGIEAVKAATVQYGRPPVLLGESIGAAVAAAVAGSGQVQVAGLILITPWDSLADLAQWLYWYLPAKYFILDRYDNVKSLKAYKGPVAVVMAEQDQIVPPISTLRLYEAIGQPKGIWRLSGVGHNSWLTAVDPGWWKQILQFLRANTASHLGSEGRFSAIR